MPDSQERRAPVPYQHTVLHRWRRQRPEDREVRVTTGVTLDWWPTLCPKCMNPCLQRTEIEASCLLCGWEQVVRPA